jgi:UDP-2,4-diacetamido-2,4,6-trideoxy-beta-L-altropyranose hydrolase
VTAETRCRAVFRVDGGVQLGSGHVMRCLTLALELARRGAASAFICRELPGHLGGRIRREGFPLSLLGPPAGPALSWQGDAAETRALLGQARPDWLIVDHYGLDGRWESELRAAAGRLLAIDDLADRPHDCDLLLDQNYFGAQTAERYRGRLPGAARMLLGPRYALLRPEYAQARAALAPRSHAPSRVLIFFGASDLSNETGRALEALCAPQLAHLAVDVVLGANHPSAAAVEAHAAARPQTTLHRELPSLAALLSRADLAVGAGGSTMWERLCLGVPSVVVTLSANQEGPTASLAAAGLVTWVGRAPQVTAAQLQAAITGALRAAPAGPGIVDGYGAPRVAAVLLPPSAGTLELRPAVQADAELLFEWRNEALTRAMSFDPAPVTWEGHLRWLDSKLADRDVMLSIGVAEGLPVGQVRLEFTGGEAHLSYGVDPLVRGRGFGAALVEQAVRRAGRVPASGFCARVKASNVASRRIFERLGWKAAPEGENFVFRLGTG